MLPIARWTKNIVNTLFRRHPRTLEEVLASNKIAKRNVGLFELVNRKNILQTDAGKILDNMG